MGLDLGSGLRIPLEVDLGSGLMILLGATRVRKARLKAMACRFPLGGHFELARASCPQQPGPGFVSAGKRWHFPWKSSRLMPDGLLGVVSPGVLGSRQDLFHHDFRLGSPVFAC